MKECHHKNVNWQGLFSLVGSYVCQECRLIINPVVFHKMKGYPHVYFREEHKKELAKCIEGLDEENLRLWNQFV